MNTDTLTCAIIGHLVGDYLLQNDWMALNKKAWNGSRECAVHCLLWTVAVMFFAGWFTTYERSLVVFFVLFWTHYAQDRTNIVMRYMHAIGQRKFSGPPCAPWSIIVVDNVWHIVTLWVVWKWIV